MSSTLKDFISQLENPVESASLPNTQETWSRIANKDSFEELELESSELESFLKEWMSDNPYENMK